MTTPRLAILGTHPVQYLAPIHRALDECGELAVKVFHTYSQAATGELFDPGFQSAVRWDIPLLQGYEHEFVPNLAVAPSLERFGGVRNPALIDTLTRWQPDALLVYGWNHASHLQAMRHFKGRIPVLFRGDSTLLDPAPWWRRSLRRTVLGWVYRHVDLALAVGRNSSDYFRWAGIPGERIRIVPHSIDVQRFADRDGELQREAEDWRASLGIGADDLVVGFAGKLQPNKDPLLLLAAVTGLQRPAHLVFFGAGELESQLRARSSAHPGVHLLPFQNQSRMPVAHRVCDLFVLPTRGPETWGLVLNEAMACGRAILASTRAGATRDLVNEGVNGLSFRAGDLAHLRAQLQRLLALGRTGLREMGRHGAAMSAEWSSEATARRIAAIVHESLR